MKIGISCAALRYSGGLERYAMDLVHGLHQEGIRPVVFARKFDTSLAEYGMVEPCRIPLHGWPGKLKDHVYAARLRARKRAMGVDCLISCNRTTVADIAICGGTHRGYLRAMGRQPGMADRWQIRLEQSQYDHARRIVAHSQLMVQELQELYGVPDSKIVLLYPPVSQQKFGLVDAAQRQALRQSLQLPQERLVFLFPSSSHVRKGYPLLEAFFRRTSLPVMLAVAGRPIKSDSPNIRYLGYRQDMENLYRAADFTILASQYEPFGLIGVESLLCGTPVVLAQQIGALEVIAPQAQFSFDAGDAASLERAVGQAVERARLGQARVAAPLAGIGYDIDVASHVRSLLQLIDTL